ncbi:alginate lyase family protein [Dyella flagellata]|nr:alginate lyase family protein [Dyella flagellata]
MVAILMASGCASDAVRHSAASTPEVTLASSGSAAWPSMGDIESLRATPARWQPLRNACDRDIGYVPHPVSDFSPPQHYVDREGEQRIAKPFTDDGHAAYREALCFAISGDRRYAVVGERILDAWAANVQRIGQGQGVADFNFTFPEYALAAAMVRTDAQWNDAAFRAFVRQRVLPISTASHANNFGNWGVLLEASSAVYLRDQSLMQKAAQRWRALMLSQVAPDGSMAAEICRSNTSNYCGGPDKGVNGLSYTHYALYPTALAAEIFRIEGIDVYKGDAGHLLSLAYARAAQWTLHPESFPYYASNHGHLNGVRNAAYFRILQRNIPCDDGRAVIDQGRLGMDGYEINLLYAEKADP